MRKVIIILVLLFFVQVNAATYYVAKNGHDTNYDGTAPTPENGAGPWLTIGKANTTLTAGDTVYVRAGTYTNDGIAPDSNGSAGNLITYDQYESETVILTGVSLAVDLTGKSYIVIDGLRFINIITKWVELAAGASYNIIQNCWMETITTEDAWAGINFDGGNTSYNKILNNTMIRTDLQADYCDTIWIDGDKVGGPAPHHNVIEGNTIRGGSHAGIEFNNIGGRNLYNVIRNNTIRSPGNTGLNVYRLADMMLIEGNIILDAGTGWNANGRGQQHGSEDCIIRRNIYVNNQYNTLEYVPNGDGPARSIGNHLYNNTYCVNNYSMALQGSTNVYDNIFKNNIFYNSTNHHVSHGTTLANYFINNCFFGTGSFFHSEGYSSLSALQAGIGTEWYGNITSNPHFVDPTGFNASNNANFDPNDVHLTDASTEMIDGGDWLTTMNGAGTLSKTLIVDDSAYFYDGWGIPGETGDVIQLEGQTVTATITDINYTDHIITVDTNMTWTDSNGLSLSYGGDAPDIGAYELLPIDVFRPQVDSNDELIGGYDFVDDEGEGDGDATVVVNITGSYLRDIYEIPDPVVELGKIYSITVYFRMRTHIVSGGADYIAKGKAYIKIGDTEYVGDEKIESEEIYTLRSHTWRMNAAVPNAFWEWDDIVDLQIGVGLKGGDDCYAYCTQLWLEVNMEDPLWRLWGGPSRSRERYR